MKVLGRTTIKSGIRWTRMRRNVLASTLTKMTEFFSFLGKSFGRSSKKSLSLRSTITLLMFISLTLIKKNKGATSKLLSKRRDCIPCKSTRLLRDHLRTKGKATITILMLLLRLDFYKAVECKIFKDFHLKIE